MGQSAEELRREIERTRGEMSENLEAIGDRVSPGRIVERRKNRMVNFIGDSRDRVFGRVDDVRSGASDRAEGARERAQDAMGTARETMRDAPERVASGAAANPLIAGGVAFGLGFLAAVVFPGTQKEAEAVQRVSEAAQPLKEEATQAAREVASSVQEAGKQAATELKDSAQERAADVKETAAQEKETVQGTATGGSSSA